MRCTRDSSEFELSVHQEGNRTLSVRVPVNQKKFEVGNSILNFKDNDEINLYTYPIISCDENLFKLKN